MSIYLLFPTAQLQWRRATLSFGEDQEGYLKHILVILLQALCLVGTKFVLFFKEFWLNSETKFSDLDQTKILCHVDASQASICQFAFLKIWIKLDLSGLKDHRIETLMRSNHSDCLQPCGLLCSLCPWCLCQPINTTEIRKPSSTAALCIFTSRLDCSHYSDFQRFCHPSHQNISQSFGKGVFLNPLKGG